MLGVSLDFISNPQILSTSGVPTSAAQLGWPRPISINNKLYTLLCQNDILLNMDESERY